MDSEEEGYVRVVDGVTPQLAAVGILRPVCSGKVPAHQRDALRAMQQHAVLTVQRVEVSSFIR